MLLERAFSSGRSINNNKNKIVILGSYLEQFGFSFLKPCNLERCLAHVFLFSLEYGRLNSISVAQWLSHSTADRTAAKRFGVRIGEWRYILGEDSDEE